MKADKEKVKETIGIVLMDGRARYSIDDALIVSAGSSIVDAAIEEAKERGDDSVVVDLENNTVLWKAGKL